MRTTNDRLALVKGCFLPGHSLITNLSGNGWAQTSALAFYPPSPIRANSSSFWGLAPHPCGGTGPSLPHRAWEFVLGRIIYFVIYVRHTSDCSSQAIMRSL